MANTSTCPPCFGDFVAELTNEFKASAASFREKARTMPELKSIMEDNALLMDCAAQTVAEKGIEQMRRVRAWQHAQRTKN